MNAIFWLRVVTWMVIVVNWLLSLWLFRMLKRARRREDELLDDAMHLATMAGCAGAEAARLGGIVPLPPETYRWMEARHLEYMVYGPHGEASEDKPPDSDEQ